MRERLILILLNILMPDVEDIPTISPKQKMVAYHESYMVENMRDLLRRQLKGFVHTVALKTRSSDEIWYYRGAIFALQQHLRSMKNYHDQFVKEQQSHGDSI